AYFECLHEVKLIVDLIYEGGIANMRYSISNTAEYGDMTRGKRVIGPEARKAMKALLADIQSGKFADEWITEYRCGLPHFRELRKEAGTHPVEEVGTRLRGLMPWLAADGRGLAVAGDRALEAPATRISIFMSPLDVHVNRSPVTGVVRDVTHTLGKFRAAFADKASLDNERNALVLESNARRYLVVQIA